MKHEKSAGKKLCPVGKTKIVDDENLSTKLVFFLCNLHDDFDLFDGLSEYIEAEAKFQNASTYSVIKFIILK